MQESLQVALPLTQAVKHSPTHSATKTLPSITEIQDWAIAYLAEALEIDADEIDVTLPFDRYGLDSSVAVGMSGDLEDWLDYEFDPTLLYDYPTIEALALHISAELEAS